MCIFKEKHFLMYLLQDTQDLICVVSAWYIVPTQQIRTKIKIWKQEMYFIVYILYKLDTEYGKYIWIENNTITFLEIYLTFVIFWKHVSNVHRVMSNSSDLTLSKNLEFSFP